MKYQKITGWQNYPELSGLLDLTTLPKEIHFIGKWNPKIFKNCVAVVGSRRMTEYGRRVIEKIIPQLVSQGQTIISGFMYGVDQYAHQVCLENGGKTIAVLGWGINLKLEGFDLKLAQKVIKAEGLLLSEWENQQPSCWTFPARNRLVAALSKKIIVIEAAEKSGSLITTRIAAKLKREIWSVPGPITSRLSAGTNALIALGKAKMYLGDFSSLQAGLSKKSDPLINLLENDVLTANEIARKLNQPVSQVGAQLSLLTLEGQLAEKEGKYYLKNVG